MKPLDFPAEPLPKELRNKYTHEGVIGYYEIVLNDISFSDSFFINCHGEISKYQKDGAGHFGRWRKVWSFSTVGFRLIIDNEGRIASDARKSLIAVAISGGVVITDMLLNKLLGSIEERLVLEHKRISSCLRQD